MLDKGGSWGDSSVGIQVLFQLEAPAKKKKKNPEKTPTYLLCSHRGKLGM
jgi:hypothetical protein